MALVAQNLLLQEQLGSHVANYMARTDGGAMIEGNGLAATHGGGGKDATMEDAGPASIQGGGGQGLGSESSDGPPSLESIRNSPWGYGEGPVGHVPSFEDFMPNRRTREVTHGRSKEGQGLLRHQELYVNDSEFLPTPQRWT